MKSISNQNGYEAGKSRSTALYQLLSRATTTLNNQEIALVAFLEIEGAFCHTLFESLIRGVKNRGVENTICDLLENMLHGRQVEVEETVKQLKRHRYKPHVMYWLSTTIVRPIITWAT